MHVLETKNIQSCSVLTLNKYLIVINLNLCSISLNVPRPLYYYLQSQFSQVSYLKFDDKPESVLLSGYYFELDYGEKNHLDKRLEYTQLYDIPNLRDLKRIGTITITIPNTDQICNFQYQLEEITNPDAVTG